MKRRTFLTGVGGGVSGLGVFSLANSNSCSAPKISQGAIVQSIVQDEILIKLDGYTVDDVSWEQINNKLAGKISVSEKCGVTEERVLLPENANKYEDICLQAISKESSTIFGRLAQDKNGEWAVLYANTD